MASILEQYDSIQSRSFSGTNLSASTNQAPVYRQETPSQGQAAAVKPEPAMFQRAQLPLRFPSNLTHFAVSNGFVVYAMENKKLRRVNLATKDEEDIDLPRDDDVIHLFMDPTGNHVILSMKSQATFYLHRLSDRFKPFLKGHAISSVGWNRETQVLYSTGPILIGTTQGVLLETNLVSSKPDDKNLFSKLAPTSLDQYTKQLYEFDAIVNGCEFGRIASTRSSTGPNNHFFIVVTPGRLYQFFGSSSSSNDSSIFHSIFEQYDVQNLTFIDLPGDIESSSLHTCTPTNSKAASFSTFAWRAPPGTYTCNIDFTARSRADSVLLHNKLIPYTNTVGGQAGNLKDGIDIPIEIVLNEFHITLLYKNRLSVVCTLNEAVVWEDDFQGVHNDKTPLLGICRDPVKNVTWIYAARTVYRLKVTNEDRDVWKTFLELGECDRALAHCNGDAHKLDMVYRKQADAFFNNQQYDQSAVIYSKTRMSFEQVTLKFISCKQDGALRAFLAKKIDAYINDPVQMTMLVTWLVELWLNQLGKLRDQTDEYNRDAMNREAEMLQEEFKYFLGNKLYRDCFRENKAIIYDLISSHGKTDDLIFFAELMQDYEKVVSHHLQRDQYTQALEHLQKQVNFGMIYKFSPVLMQHVPKITVDMWIRISTLEDRPPLEPKKLIPALVQYDMNRTRSREQPNEAIRYLEFCMRVLKNKDQAIHNYLISLYAEHDPEKLLNYLKYQGQDAEFVNYDLKYALRLCSQKELDKACVHIYSTMGLYSESVDLALKVNPSLARENANKACDDDERKKLWLAIAKHVVQNEKDIDKAMKVLRDCELLKIEDILPFFPDFVTIEKFKEAITSSLSEYNEHISGLKSDMQETTENAESIRAEIQNFRKQCSTVQVIDKCSVCDFPLLTRSFYIFPCSHKFHTDCHVREVLPLLSPLMRKRVEELQKKMVTREESHTVSSGSNNVVQISAKEELDDIVAAECVYCGEAIISTIDIPLVSRTEYEESDSWI